MQEFISLEVELLTSTVLMNAIPAKVAGVEEIIMVSPGNKEGKLNKTVLAAAHLSEINKVFRIGELKQLVL